MNRALAVRGVRQCLVFWGERPTPPPPRAAIAGRVPPWDYQSRAKSTAEGSGGPFWLLDTCLRGAVASRGVYEPYRGLPAVMPNLEVEA